MSDEESFVILGTSPLSSLEPDGNYEHKATLSSTSVESDTPGSNFSSLKRSQLIDLQNARETSMPGHAMEEAAASTQQSSNETQMSATSGLKHSSLIKSIQIEENSKEKSFDKYRDTLAIAQMADPIVMMKPVKSIESTNTDTNNAESKLWSRTPKVYKNTDEELSLGLWDCAIKSPLGSVNQQKDELNAPQKATSTSNPTSLEKTCIASNGRHLTPSASASNSLASSFIMGEINADVLKVNISVSVWKSSLSRLQLFLLNDTWLCDKRQDTKKETLNICSITSEIVSINNSLSLSSSNFSKLYLLENRTSSVFEGLMLRLLTLVQEDSLPSADCMISPTVERNLPDKRIIRSSA